MRRREIWLVASVAMSSTAPVSAQNPRPPGPVAAGDMTEAVSTRVGNSGVPRAPKRGGDRIRFNLREAKLSELIHHIGGLTGKRFIYGEKVRKIKVNVTSPTRVSVNEAYEAFLSTLAVHGLTVVPHGGFMKVVASAGVATRTTPVYSPGALIPNTDRFVTRLHRLKHVSPKDMAALLTKFKSKQGDISVYQPGSLLILTDRGSNIRRLMRIVEEADVGGAARSLWVEPIRNVSSDSIAKQLNEIFELGGPGGGKTARGLTRVLSDERTNSLVVVGTDESHRRLRELLRRIDVVPAVGSQIRVLALQHAVAEDLAGVLTQMLGSAATKRGRAGASRTAGGQFDGEIRVTADSSTNSLVVASSSRDYARLRLIIDKLDRVRRQVFIEAVIMDVSAGRSGQLGLAYHAGATAGVAGASDAILLGGFEPLSSVAPGPDQLQGLALGARGPDLAGTQNRFPRLAGLSIPAFGVVLNALASSGDANVLATPHIIAMDNTTAEINVGENIPLQNNVAGFPPLGALAGGQAPPAGQQNPVATLNALSRSGGFGSAARQDVGTRIKVTPRINDQDQVRLEIEEEISERGATTGTLGAVSITQRSATTTVVVDDQQTVVVGGLMRDSIVSTKRKIPVLGDLPVLGFLFRSSEDRERKTNLLLVLTPHVIRGQEDLRRVFQRKMRERQEFLDRYFVFRAAWAPPRDWSRTNGLVEEIRQSQRRIAARLRLQEGARAEPERHHAPTVALDLPAPVRGDPAVARRKAAAKRKAAQAKKRKTRAKKKRKTAPKPKKRRRKPRPRRR